MSAQEQPPASPYIGNSHGIEDIPTKQAAIISTHMAQHQSKLQNWSLRQAGSVARPSERAAPATLTGSSLYTDRIHCNVAIGKNCQWNVAVDT